MAKGSIASLVSVDFSRAGVASGRRRGSFCLEISKTDEGRPASSDSDLLH